MYDFAGIKFVEHPLLPKYAPNFRFDPEHKCQLSDEFRAKMEAWCLEFFGVSPFFIVVGKRTFMAHPESMQPFVEKLRQITQTP